MDVVVPANVGIGPKGTPGHRACVTLSSRPKKGVRRPSASRHGLAEVGPLEKDSTTSRPPRLASSMTFRKKGPGSMPGGVKIAATPRKRSFDSGGKGYGPKNLILGSRNAP